MKKEFRIDYIDESGTALTSRIFACDEADVRKIFLKIYGDQCRVESIIRHEIEPNLELLLEFE